MKLKVYLIRCDGEKLRFVKPIRDQWGSFDLVDKPDVDCLMDGDQAKAFMARPGLDPRYSKEEFTLGVNMRRRKNPQRVDRAILGANIGD